jgi:hypothetical protein
MIKDRPDQVSQLLDQGVDYTIEDKWGDTALDVAVRNLSYAAIAKYVEKAKIDLSRLAPRKQLLTAVITNYQVAETINQIKQMNQSNVSDKTKIAQQDPDLLDLSKWSDRTPAAIKAVFHEHRLLFNQLAYTENVYLLLDLGIHFGCLSLVREFPTNDFSHLDPK